MKLFASGFCKDCGTIHWEKRGVRKCQKRGHDLMMFYYENDWSRKEEEKLCS